MIIYNDLLLEHIIETQDKIIKLLRKGKLTDIEKGTLKSLEENLELGKRKHEETKGE
ncbi:hypothetical protein [Vibrio anguillarum]|uniref:hypothetical protein n=1 Tax=Vibrio anguillarum TaxID=55601 RepID=UPI0002E2DD56|nr:hypothetical protein [Vibrio anguillarum]UJQ41284.1 hypothetical protein L2O48_03200 [Vibrio anguillarum]